MRPRPVALSLAASLVLGCGDDPIPPPTRGLLRVEVVTTGGDLDVDGYVVFLDGMAVGEIGANATSTLEGIVQGEHTAELRELALNCAVVGDNPRSVAVVPDVATSISFEVACIATGVRVVVMTTGVDSPALHGVIVANVHTSRTDSTTAAANGAVRIGRLLSGVHTIDLTVGSGNCTIVTPNPVSVTIDVGDNPEVSFAVECAATSATILVSASTTGIDRSPSGYPLFVDGIERASLEKEGSVAVEGILAGDHTVAIADVPANCTTAEGASRTVSVSTGGMTRDTAEVAFGIACNRVWDMAFTRTSADGAAVYLARADGADTAFVASGEEAEWSPDGTEIVFTTPTVCVDGYYYYYYYGYDVECTPGGLRVANTEGDALDTLTSDDSDTGATWRPDGSKIAFTRESRLHLVSPDGTGAAPIPTTGEMPASDPSWSPDGASLAFTCEVEPGNVDICVVGADGSGLVRLTDDPGRDARPAWSPDGSRLAFTTTRFGGTNEIALVAPDGAGLTRVAPGTGASHPSWIDDTTIVFAASECDIYRGCIHLGLSRMQHDGMGFVQLTSERDNAPAWRP